MILDPFTSCPRLHAEPDVLGAASELDCFMAAYYTKAVNEPLIGDTMYGSRLVPWLMLQVKRVAAMVQGARSR